MQEMKKRYYTIAAILLEIQIPKSNMTPTEFQLYEKMSGFNAQIENTRKELAEKLFERTKDEAEEERVLLEELKRITMNEEDFLKMRRDLYSRLEPPPTKRSNGEEQSTAMYQTSTGLSALLQNLLAKEKRMKRPSVMPNGEGTPSSATDDGRNSQRWEKGRHPNQYSRRDTLDSNDGAAAGPQKKFSQSQPNIRRLTSDDEVKFGVSYPQERLTSGVAFRHEKATKVLQGKSSVQAQKISNALTELGIPPRLGMPTEKVCKEFERLVQAIHLLLDARKGVERVILEVKILEDAKRQRLGVPKEGEEEEDEEEERTGDAMKVDGEAKAVADPEPEAEIDDSVVEADKPDQTDGAGDNEDESKVEAEEPENEDEENEQEDEADEDAENASDAEVDESDAEQARVSRKRLHEESPQVSENDDEDNTGVNQGDDEEEQEDEELNAVDIEDEADSNADLGSQNDVSEEENEEDDADEDEVEQEEDEEADAEAEAEIEESEPSESARLDSAQSAVSRLKRSASVLSDASKAGSNRSGVGRKKRR